MAEDLRALAEAATPGRWVAGGTERQVEVTSAEDDLIYRRIRDGQAPLDAAYIAAANPTAVLALLDRVEAAEAAVAKALEVANNLRDAREGLQPGSLARVGLDIAESRLRAALDGTDR